MACERILQLADEAIEHLKILDGLFKDMWRQCEEAKQTGNGKVVSAHRCD